MRTARSTFRLLVLFAVGFTALFLVFSTRSPVPTSPDDFFFDEDDYEPIKPPTAWRPSFNLPDLPKIPFISSSSPSKSVVRKRILVTGGAGVVGLPLVKRLIEEGYDVTLLDIRKPNEADIEYLQHGRDYLTVAHEQPSDSEVRYDKRAPTTIPSSTSRDRGKLQIVISDIRQPRQLSTLFQRAHDRKRPFSGIIHLAGVSRTTWCAAREEECEKLTLEGLRNVYAAAMEVRGERDGTDGMEGDIVGGVRAGLNDPWFVLASSLDAYGYEGKLGEGSMSVLGKVKYQAEKVMKELHDGSTGKGRKAKSVILRHSTTYGARTDFKDRLLPALILKSGREMPVQIMDDEEKVDWLRIEDGVEAFVKTAKLLEGEQEEEQNLASELKEDLSINAEAAEELEKRQDISGGGYYDEFDIVSGHTTTVRQIANIVMTTQKSGSPIQDYSQYKHHKPGPYRRVTPVVSPRLEEVLGWKATIPLDVGLAALIGERQLDFIGWAKEYLKDYCPNSKYGDERLVVEADLRNQHLERLMGCTVNMGVNHKGWIHHMKCGEKDGISCQADNIKRDSYNWNQSVFTIQPGGEFFLPAMSLEDNANPPERRKRDLWERAVKGKEAMTIRLQEEQTGLYWGFALKKAQQEGTKNRPIRLKLYSVEEAAKPGVVTEFEPRVQRNASYLQLMIAGKNEYIHVEPQLTTTQFEVARWTPKAAYDIRMTLLCCPTSEPWPLLLDDYETADIKYGSTGDIPFDASLRKHECKRVEQALEHAQSKRSGLISNSANQQAANEAGMPAVNLAQEHFSIKTTPLPHEWKDKDLPVCMNDCSSPSICVQTGRCRCIQADDCVEENRNPLAPVIVSKKDKLISIVTNDDFVKAVEKISWKDLLLPQARRVLDEYPDLIKVHVVSGYEREEEMESMECHKLADNHCFSADNIMYRAMRHISVPADEADLLILPVYQHCEGGSFLLHDVYHYASQTIPNFNDRPKTVVLTHDWGICIAFAWNIWEAKTDNRLYPDFILDNTISWSVQGDSNTKCYRPHQDVVIPARTCNSVKLKETFGGLHDVTPVAQRNLLISWSGTHWGTGKNTRLRLVCPRGGLGEKELVAGAGAQSKWFDWDYMEQLRQARFCPQPTGIAGWSFRVQDAIYAGCIPVFLADGTHYPFADILDWSKFSVRLSPVDLDHVEDILAEIPLEKVEELQANLVAIREAFLYSTDDAPEEELKRKGPLFFALQSARIRLATRYPTTKGGEEPATT